MFFDSKKQLWPDPEKSVGNPCVMVFKGTQCWEAVGLAGDAMKDLCPRIKELLENSQELLEEGEEKPRGIGFNMWMEGKDPATSQPIIVFSSKSRRQRTCAKSLLKQSQILQRYPGIKVKTLDRMPAAYRMDSSGDDCCSDQGTHNKISVYSGDCFACGASINFAIPAHAKGPKRSRRATLAGLVSIDGLYYGLTAQHTRFVIQEDLAFASEEHEILAFDEDSDETDHDDTEATSQGIFC